MLRPNRLAGETSPYLRQHADNPVDWHPWGPEALAEAKRRDVPLFVSIGYSACHWCHVMAHESFEDEDVARVLNTRFVTVKVDREERPDVDAVYMEAVQALHDGRGGWPLTVFATPDGKPFYGGTYYPPVSRPGAPSFSSVVEAVATAWTERRTDLVEQAGDLTDAVAARLRPDPSATRAPARQLLADALDRAEMLFDEQHGGFGGAPKFPQPLLVELLLRAHLAGHSGALDKATTTLASMAAGGIYDHLGGGFARYSTDARWHVPHFEKMLYDQALIARAYLHAWQLTGLAELRQVLDETLDYVLRELRDRSGGICSSQDADSDGEEGRYYTWTPAELEDVLGASQAGVAADWYGVGAQGHLEGGRSVLHREPGATLLRPAAVERARAALLAVRRRRVPPGLDDKILTEWNAMACAVLAEAGAATGDGSWIRAAVEIAAMLRRDLRRPDGRWMRSWHEGQANHLGVAADYAWLVECFTRLGEVTGEARYLADATEVASGLVELFSAPDGGWYTTGSDAEQLVVRPRDTYDGATPSAASVAATALARLGALTGDELLVARAAASVDAAGAALSRSPFAFPGLVTAALLLDGGLVEVVLGMAADRSLLDTVREAFLPEVVLCWGEPTPSTLWLGRDDPADRRGYVCRAGTCLAPVTDARDLLASIGDARLDAAIATGTPAAITPGAGSR